MFDTSPQLDCNGRILRLDRPRVMGIVNVTPDSFSDGGAHFDADAAIAHGLRLAEEGADILDVGGESTRPGSQEVPVEEELRRVVPVIEGLARETTLPISIDTCKPEVMRAAVAAGAGMLNDVYGLRREGALDAAAELGVPVVLMHMLGEPRSMQAAPEYDDVVGEVHRFLAERIFAAEMAGIAKKNIIVDPGFGFGKTTAPQPAAAGAAAALHRAGRAGAGRAVAQEQHRRDHRSRARRASAWRGSVAAHLIAAQNGAMLLRVHDVAATVDALKVWAALAALPPPRKAAEPAGDRLAGITARDRVGLKCAVQPERAHDRQYPAADHLWHLPAGDGGDWFRGVALHPQP